MKYHHSFKRAIEEINLLGRLNCPFLFLIDFEMERPYVFPAHSLPDGLLFNFNGKGNTEVLTKSQDPSDFYFKAHPICLNEYARGFDIVMEGIKKGDSFLTNLTFPTKVETSLSFNEIYSHSTAKYKLKFFDEWVVFSPESFIKIENGIIRTFPMKGTIDATHYNAANTILNNKKEKAEHNTVVDLLRNDLSRVAKNVHVSDYRYLDKIKSHQKEILQVSSTITGSVSDYYMNHLGELFSQLLPAGSISGAPKEKTCQIIREAEGQPRGFYTGIAAYFDGQNVDSCVLIRYIEQQGNELIARSGGGITFMSNLESEYQEMIDKVYVPINRNHKDSQRSGYEYPMAQSAV